MGAAWRGPRDRELARVVDLVRAVKSEGLETCCTLGMLKEGHAEALKEAGLDYYNHNLDTAPEFYGEIVSTRVYQDRLDTLARVRDAGIAVCCGGIVGMGESRRQRAGLVAQLANLDPYPESVPINHLVQVEGTPLHDRFQGESALDPFDFVRTIAAARITMPKAMVRLSAGRREFSEAVFLRRSAADHRQPGCRSRSGAVRETRACRDVALGRPRRDSSILCAVT